MNKLDKNRGNKKADIRQLFFMIRIWGRGLKAP